MSRTPAEQAPATPAGALPVAVNDLLAAVLEALDIPHPASVGDSDAHGRLLLDRAMHARIALRSVLEDNTISVEWTAGYLRERLAKHPVAGYVTVEQAHAALAAGATWSEAVTLSAGEDQ